MGKDVAVITDITAVITAIATVLWSFASLIVPFSSQHVHGALSVCIHYIDLPQAVVLAM